MYYITTPIPYTNSEPHLGHLLEGVFNDTIARYYRRRYDGHVKLSMGLDQHGLKIYEKAIEQNIKPQEFVDKEGEKFIKLWDQFNVNYDTWIPTTSKKHKVVTQLIWAKLEKKGYIYKKKYKGLYCKGCEDFYAPSQLDENGNCPTHLSKPVELDEENYFFKLSAFEDVVLNFLKTADIKPKSIVKEQTNFVKDGLQDISISRDKKRMPWGIDVPGDDSQVMYVWFEALINYLTGAVGDEEIDAWEKYPHLQKEAEIAMWEDIVEHMPIDLLYASKEISKFHFVIWPAMLSALELELPKRGLAHGMINDSEGKKFSKSLGNGVVPQELVEKVGIDGARFLILHEINIDGDTKFDWNTMLEAYNSHLSNNIGNLLMRVTTLIDKNFSGLVEIEDAEELFDFSQVYHYLENLDTRNALEEILKAGRKGNEILEQTKPWKLIKDGKTDEAKQILTNLIALLKEIGQHISIFIPTAGDKIYQSASQDIITKAEILFPKAELIEE